MDVGQRTSEHATSWSGGSALAPLRVATPLDGSVSKISTDPTIKRKKTFPDQIRDLTDLSALISPAVGFLTPNEKKKNPVPMETTRFQGRFCRAVRFIWAGAKGYRNSDAEQTKWTLVQFISSVSANGASTLNTGSEPTTGDMS